MSSEESDPAAAGPVIRAATEADAGAINDLVHGARLNPRDLDWRRFLVADDAGNVVACAQVRVHGGGTRELASVAVTPGRQGEGIGRAIAEAAIAREPVRPLHLMTESRTVAFWERLGFQTVGGDAIPADIRRSFRIGRIAVSAMSMASRTHYSISIMRRDQP